MQMVMRTLRSGFGLACLIFFGTQHAYAGGVKDIISTLIPLPLNDVVTSLKIGHRNVRIITATFASEGAWGEDGYSVIVQDDGRWQYARREEGVAREVVLWSAPHTGEDVITSLTFLIPKNTNPKRNIPALYVLETQRDIAEDVLAAVPVKLTLYSLQRDDDFGIFYLRPIANETSLAAYCNADFAAFHELGIPLPGDGTEYPCEE